MTTRQYMPRNTVSITTELQGEKIVAFTTDRNFKEFLLKSNWSTVKIIGIDTEGNKPIVFEITGKQDIL